MRPTKYDPAIAAQVLQHIEAGGTLASFAEERQISRRTVTYWAAGNTDFGQAVAKARAAAQSAEPAPTIHAGPVVFSLSAWGAAHREVIESRKPARLSEDDVDDMLAAAA